jgi:hypothetical protein
MHKNWCKSFGKFFYRNNLLKEKLGFYVVVMIQYFFAFERLVYIWKLASFWNLKMDIKPENRTNMWAKSLRGKVQIEYTVFHLKICFLLQIRNKYRRRLINLPKDDAQDRLISRPPRAFS